MGVLTELNFDGPIRLFLEDEDDPALWAAVFDTLSRDFGALCSAAPKGFEVYFQVGACSHWLRPHQTRLKAAGGFAYPAGYLGSGFSRRGLPEFDWYTILRRDREEGTWAQTRKFFGKRRVVCRVALPTRTLRHRQAAVHVFWSPGTPDNPEVKRRMYYGYRKVERAWVCVASGGM
jgi:hypothetical protein